jgi:exopolysaccharide biosynthesis polyprenyl glycosylphosphotransferase
MTTPEASAVLEGGRDESLPESFFTAAQTADSAERVRPLLRPVPDAAPDLTDEDGPGAEPKAVDQLRRTVELARIRRVHRGGPLYRINGTVALLALSDLVGAAIALIASAQLHHRWIALMVVGIILPTRAGWGILRPRLHMSILDELPKMVVATSAGIGFGALILVLAGRDEVLGALIHTGGIFLVASLVVQTLTFAAVRRLRRRRELRRRTLILGAGTIGRQVSDGLLAAPEFGLEPIGFLDPAEVDTGNLLVPVLSHETSALGELIVEQDISTVIVAFVDDVGLVDVMLTCTHLDTDILIVPRLFELVSDDDKTDWVNGVPLVRTKTNVTSRPSWMIKRAVDVLAATLALIALSPVMLLAAAAVVFDSGWPVLFRQHRVGIDGEPFELFKFRSMRPVDDHEQQTQWNIAGDPRLGRVGKWLRRTSIDELPQLFNILRGDMSLVGPRPERPAFVEQFTAEHDGYWARHRIPVGLTGWAQVNGLRGDTSIAQRARFDNYYVANWSLWLDVKITFLTVREVFRGSGS